MTTILKSIANIVDIALRLGGAVGNIAMVIGFAYAALFCKAQVAAAFAAFGHPPEPTVVGLTAFAKDPSALDRCAALGGAWVFGILGAGCAWMTFLGLRWCYHGAIAAVHRLRFLN